MRKLFILGAVFVFSVAMLMTACKKDEVNNNGNNNGGGTAAGYVDLGLPSGTKWKSANETGDENGFYTYHEAVNAFGDKLPTKEQLEELKENCTWVWQNNGYKVTGTNGNSIVLPAAGCSQVSVQNGNVYGVGEFGILWSSTLYDADQDGAWSLYFGQDGVGVGRGSLSDGISVRLVQD